MSLLALALAAASPSAAVPVKIERTFLKAKPGKAAELERYIVANWFAMDAVALRRGLFTDYTLARASDPTSEWDFVVSVGYPQAKGFDDPSTQKAWAVIKASHKEVRVAGRSLPDLGAIVRSESLIVLAGDGRP